MTSPAQSLELLGMGCFGKLPVSREFIVEGAAGLAESGFDKWVGEGVGLAKARLGSRFNEQISTFPPYRFFWDGGDDQKLVGVICPSEDAAGRKHPFAFFARLGGKRVSALSSALQVWSLQEQIADLFATVSGADSPAAVREAARSARLVSGPGGTETEEQYRRFIQEQLGDTFWSDLEGSQDNDGRYMIVQALLETLTPWGADKDRTFSGGIRYPLPRGGHTAAALASCFWLDLTDRCLGRAIGAKWWFRSPGATGSENRSLFLFLSSPGGKQWASLIDPEADLDSVSYLDRPYGTEPPEERMDPKLRTILAANTSSLSDYLRWASGS